MARCSSSLGGFRTPLLAVVVTALLLIPAAISAQAAEDEAVPTASPPITDPAAPPLASGSDSSDANAVPPGSPPAAPPASTEVTVSRASASAFRSVSIIDFEFDPDVLSVKVGDTVTWTNLGTAEEGHDATGDGLESGLLNTGGVYSHTFKAAGTFSYICTIHPKMKGTVEVLARSSGSGESDRSSGSGEGGASGGGGSDAGSSGAESESSAVSSPDAAGSSSSLPATGQRLLPPLAVGLMLLIGGLGLRTLAPRARRRG